MSERVAPVLEERAQHVQVDQLERAALEQQLPVLGREPTQDAFPPRNSSSRVRARPRASPWEGSAKARAPREMNAVGQPAVSSSASCDVGDSVDAERALPTSIASCSVKPQVVVRGSPYPGAGMRSRSRTAACPPSRVAMTHVTCGQRSTSSSRKVSNSGILDRVVAIFEQHDALKAGQQVFGDQNERAAAGRARAWPDQLADRAPRPPTAAPDRAARRRCRAPPRPRSPQAAVAARRSGDQLDSPLGAVLLQQHALAVAARRSSAP